MSFFFHWTVLTLMWNFQLTVGEPCLPDYTLVFPVDPCLGVLTLKTFPFHLFMPLYGLFVFQKKFSFNVELMIIVHLLHSNGRTELYVPGSGVVSYDEVKLTCGFSKFGQSSHNNKVLFYFIFCRSLCHHHVSMETR